MMYRLDDGTMLRAKSPADFVHQWHGLAFVPDKDDQAFMDGIAKRLLAVYQVKVRSNSARAFVTDLIAAGRLTREDE